MSILYMKAQGHQRMRGMIFFYDFIRKNIDKKITERVGSENVKGHEVRWHLLIEISFNGFCIKYGSHWVFLF